MKNFTTLLLFVCLFSLQTFAVDWAVLVAGSSSWDNYRHQADVCHARRIASKNGIASENIIAMVYDDIAQNSQNPFPGKIFNRPATGEGYDVYAGCVAEGDYTGDDVSADNFLAVLTGNSSAVPPGKKVLKTSLLDNVFVNFVDHGATGIVVFPDRILSNMELISALKVMKQKEMYNKLVFYLEACESGSMFDGILEDTWNIYATTASSPDQPSWGTYCPPLDVVDGQELNTCLGDLYEVSWEENLDNVGESESLEAQYDVIKKEVDKSTVMQYGDMNFASLPMSDFLGNQQQSRPRAQAEIDLDERRASSISSRDIPLHLAYYRYQRADPKDFMKKHRLASELIQQINHRNRIDYIFLNLLTSLLGSPQRAQEFLNTPTPVPAICGPCCEEFHRQFQKHCGSYDDYSLQYSRVALNLCQRLNHQNIVKVQGIWFKKLCSQ